MHEGCVLYGGDACTDECSWRDPNSGVGLVVASDSLVIDAFLLHILPLFLPTHTMHRIALLPAILAYYSMLYNRVEYCIQCSTRKRGTLQPFRFNGFENR